MGLQRVGHDWLTKHRTHSTWCYCLGKQQKQHLKSFYLFCPFSSPFHIGGKFKITIGSVFIELPVPHFKLCIDHEYPSHLPLVRLIQGFPGGLDSKESTYNTRDLGSIPELGRSPGEGNDNPFQYSCLVNPMDRGASWAVVHVVAESDTTEWLTLWFSQANIFYNQQSAEHSKFQVRLSGF